MLFVWRQVVVRLLNHVVAVGDLALLKGPLVDVDVGVVLQVHCSLGVAMIKLFTINLHSQSIMFAGFWGFGVLGFVLSYHV